MIEHILIRDSIAFSSLELEFCSGFNVISGVSGAGKSVLLDSILALFGFKEVSANLLEGRLSLDFAIFDITLEDFGILYEKDLLNECVISSIRRQSVRYFINNQSISKRKLSQITTRFVKFVSIKEGNELDSEYMLDILDSICSTKNNTEDFNALLQSYRETFHNYKKVNATLSSMRESQKNIVNLKDFAMFEIEKITKINPQIGEYEKLLEDKRKLSKKEKIIEHSSRAFAALDNLECVRKTFELLKIDSSAFSSCIEDTYALLEQGIESFSNIDFEPEELLERLSILSELNRRYGSEGEALEYLREQQEKLKEYENIEFDMANIEQEARDLESNLLFLAKKITKIRQDNLEIFIDYLNDFAKELRLPHITLNLDSKDMGDLGMDSLEIFMDSKDKSVLSSGEYNRLRLCMLCAGVKSLKSNGGILILDEIDANLSGEESYGVARLLAFLSKSYQIFAISHQPFMPLLSDNHYLVYKDMEGKSHVKLLDEEGRIAEIARIISGSNLNEDAMQYAKALLKGISNESRI